MCRPSLGLAISPSLERMFYGLVNRISSKELLILAVEIGI